MRAARVWAGLEGRSAADTSSVAVMERMTDSEVDLSSEDMEVSFRFAF